MSETHETSEAQLAATPKTLGSSVLRGLGKAIPAIGSHFLNASLVFGTATILFEDEAKEMWDTLSEATSKVQETITAPKP